MARYQLRRPSPVVIVPRRVRRQAPAATPQPGAEEEEEEEEGDEEEEDEGPESPDSPMSSPSTVGEMSESEDSESDDDEEEEEDEEEGPPSPAENAAEQAINGTDAALPSLTIFSSSSGNLAALPQVTGTALPDGPSRPSSAPTAAPTLPATPAQSDTAGQSDNPTQSKSQEKTLLTKGAAAAAITLSILGALAIVVAVVLLMKRRKRRQRNHQPLADDAFDPGNPGYLPAPETAHVVTTSVFGGAAGGSHLTRSTERSDTLFGPGPYERPETVSTDRNKSRFPISIAPPQPTPNPFADPPLNKAYDVLAGRPRSTTLTDRGSWVKNPFKNPESERFDPFGEMQQKARDERKRYLEASRKEAEAAREAEVRRQFGEKERMGLDVPEHALRKGSDVTIDGLGILDRSGANAGYR